MRYHSKDQLVADIIEEHSALVELLYDFSDSLRESEGVWGDGWTVSDLLAHLGEWHRMLLRWFNEGKSGEVPAMPAPGYKWNETPKLNRAIWEKYRTSSFESVKKDFDSTHAEVLELVRRLSEDELFERGHWAWTGKNALVTYVGANTASHYRFAQKVLKRWRRQLDGSS